MAKTRKTADESTTTVTRLARQFGLSRSTLLYYDRIGLLPAGNRRKGDYRRYTQEDVQRLEQVCKYRRAGLSLDAIGRILRGSSLGCVHLLAKRLDSLNDEIRELREQQRYILALLGNKRSVEDLAFLSRAGFVRMLEQAGFTQNDMARLHQQLEQHNPEQHQRFLEFLCIADEEIQEIRKAAT